MEQVNVKPEHYDQVRTYAFIINPCALDTPSLPVRACVAPIGATTLKPHSSLIENDKKNSIFTINYLHSLKILIIFLNLFLMNLKG